MASKTWAEVAPGTGVYLYEYPVPSVGIGSNAIVFPMSEGAVGVLSPGLNTSAELFADLEKLGRVAAIVAPNIGHDLGLREWQARYPDVPFYASLPTVKAVAKAKKDLRPLQSLAELLPTLPEGVRLWEAPGTSAGTVFMAVRRGGHEMLYLDDLVANMAALPGKQPFRFFFWLSGSAPGLKLSKVFKFFFVKNARAMARSVLDHAEAHPPTVLLFAHGGTITDASLSMVSSVLAPML
jgi:hypothetical protein